MSLNRKLMKLDKKSLVMGIYVVLVIIIGRFLLVQSGITPEVVRLGYAIAFFGLIPRLLIKKGFKENFESYNWPETRYFKKQMIFSIVVAVLSFVALWIGVIGIWLNGFDNVLVWKNWGMIKIFILTLTVFPMGLFLQEFFLRGFLLNGWRKSFGDWRAVLAVALVAVLFAVIQKGAWDWFLVLGVFVLNIILSWMVIRLRSFVFSFLVYWLILIMSVFWLIWRFSG